MRIFLIIFILTIFVSTVVASDEYLTFKVKKSIALQSLAPYVKQLKSEYKKVSQAIDDLNVKIANALTKKEKLQKDLGILEGDIRELEKDKTIKELKKEIADLKSELEEYDDEDEWEDED